MLPLLQSPNFYGRAEEEKHESPKSANSPAAKKTKKKLLMVAPKLLLSWTGFLKKLYKLMS